MQRACHLLPPHGSRPGRPPLGNVPILSRRYNSVLLHLGGAPRRLSEVFERLRHAKLNLGATKCTFAVKEVSYLGHRVTEEGLLPDPSLLAAIRDIPPPTTATEVRSFLGLAGYYRCYVKGFATIAAPLRALTRKDAVFHWSEDCQTAFDQLKTRLTTSPITAFPDFSQAFRLYTDGSTAGLGAILAQVRDGKERIICCASRALNKAEKSYPATKLECLAIVWAVAKFRPYLMAMPFGYLRTTTHSNG